jgi:hypothetical protein
MKTFRQELRNWLKEKKGNETNPDVLLLLEEIIDKTNTLEKHEENIINRAYQRGHMDAERNKNPKGNYYREEHKINSTFRERIRKNK